MLKKGLIVAAGAALLGGLIFGPDALSYVGTSLGWVKQSVRESVPIEFEIERARGMCKDLVPDIRKNMHVIAKEEVEVERLGKEIAQLDGRLEKEKSAMMTLRGDLGSSSAQFVYAGRKFTAQQVEKDLANRLERYKTNQATLDSLRDMQAARQRNLEAARQKLDGMLAAKRQLEVDVQNLEARLKMVEVAQTTSDCNIDDSRLGRVKELIGDLRSRLSVAEKLANADQYLESEIPVSEEDPQDTLANFDDYFELDRPSTADVASGGAEVR